MNVIEKIFKKQEERAGAESVTIVCVGDSVTEGCFECYTTESGGISTVFDRTSSYSARLSQLLAKLYPTVQINVINSGLSGARAGRDGVKHLERDVLRFSPDLVIVSYGLNDSGAGMEGLDDYESALSNIFERIKASGAEIIFLTQNYMCTSVSPHLDDSLKELAKNLCERQNSGLMDAYFDRAKQVCGKHGVTVCDLYSVWKRMAENGVNVTELLSNKLNHPIKEYHYYIALKLFETMIEI